MAVATGTAILAAAALGTAYQAYSGSEAKRHGAAKEARAQEDADIALRGLQNQETVSEEQKKQANLRARQKSLTGDKAKATSLYPSAAPENGSIVDVGARPPSLESTANTGTKLLGS